MFDRGDRAVRYVVHYRNVLVGAAEFHDHVAGYWYVAGAVPMELKPPMVVGATAAGVVDVGEAAPVLFVVQARRELNALPATDDCDPVPAEPVVSGNDGAHR